MGDTVIVAAWLKQDQNYKHYTHVGKPISDVAYFGPGSGIAVAKGKTKLLMQLNTALNVIEKDGQYQKIMNKWFGA